MFSHTEGANRLCKFLEISAIAVSLATQGGEQGKQGYLVSHHSLPMLLKETLEKDY